MPDLLRIAVFIAWIAGSYSACWAVGMAWLYVTKILVK